MTGDFDITVDDEANISQLDVDVQAQESVADGHDLGIRSHAEFGAGAGFSGMSHNADALTLEITDENNATSADLLPLFTSALTSVTAGAHILGSAAEKFWRDGKCIEVIVAPAGGDVDANSTTEVTVKVKHRIEGNEINKPVEATLNGVKTIDPAGVKQPAPANVHLHRRRQAGRQGRHRVQVGLQPRHRQEERHFHGQGDGLDDDRNGSAGLNYRHQVRRPRWRLADSGTRRISAS